MFGILARLLEVLYSVWPSYGGSIVLFTLVVMLILTPLTLKGTRSMLAMQALQPEMKKLQNRYKDDRAKLNEEMMKFYQENKISPLGGCLPMLIQLPVFFILYEVLLGLTRRGPYGLDLGASISCHLGNGVACVNRVFTAAGHFDPKYLKSTSRLYQDLSSTRTMSSWGLDLSQSPLKALGHGFGHALPYILMVVVVVALTYFQQVQLQSRTPKNADINPTQQMTMKLMPVVMGVIYLIIPAGVVVYFLVSSVFRIGQQAVVTRSFYSGPNAMAIPATATDNDAPAKKKSFLANFMPSKDSLPHVSKESRPTFKDPAADVPASQAKAKSGGERPAAAKRSASTKTKSEANGKPPTSNKPASKQRSSQSPKRTEPNVVESTAVESDPAAGTEGGDSAAPSRKAPAKAPRRRAPTAPSSAGGKRKKS